MYEFTNIHNAANRRKTRQHSFNAKSDDGNRNTLAGVVRP